MKITDEISILRNYILQMRDKFGKEEWLDDNTFQFKTKTKVIGKAVMDHTNMEITGTSLITFIKKLLEEKKKLEKNKITEDKAKKSVFKNAFEKKNKYNGLVDNPLLFNKLHSEFTKVGIKEIVMEKNIGKTNYIKKHPTLFINCDTSDNIAVTCEDGYYTRLRNFLYTELENNAENSESLRVFRTCNYLRPFRDEKTEDIKIKGMVVGTYYKERNLLQLYFNPFLMTKIQIFDKKPNNSITELLLELNRIKIKKVGVDALTKKIFITSFLKNSENKLNSINSDKRQHSQNISDCEREILRAIRSLHNLDEEKQYLEKLISTKGKGMYEEAKKVEKLSFVTKLKIENGLLVITFKPTSIKVSDFRKGDHGTSYGKRTFYVGSITVTISPGEIRMSSDIKGLEHPHPHANTDGTPCFGDGDGRKKIYEMLASNKFSELSKLLWFWIKTFRNSGAYRKMWNVYKDNLINGIPVWDEKGKRIVINDKDKLATNEQEHMEKSEFYEDNIKKYEKIKIC